MTDLANTCDRCGQPGATTFTECRGCGPTPLCERCTSDHWSEVLADRIAATQAYVNRCEDGMSSIRATVVHALLDGRDPA